MYSDLITKLVELQGGIPKESIYPEGTIPDSGYYLWSEGPTPLTREGKLEDLKIRARNTLDLFKNLMLPHPGINTLGQNRAAQYAQTLGELAVLGGPLGETITNAAKRVLYKGADVLQNYLRNLAYEQALKERARQIAVRSLSPGIDPLALNKGERDEVVSLFESLGNMQAKLSKLTNRPKHIQREIKKAYDYAGGFEIAPTEIDRLANPEEELNILLRKMVPTEEVIPESGRTRIPVTTFLEEKLKGLGDILVSPHSVEILSKLPSWERAVYSRWLKKANVPVEPIPANQLVSEWSNYVNSEYPLYKITLDPAKYGRVDSDGVVIPYGYNRMFNNVYDPDMKSGRIGIAGPYVLKSNPNTDPGEDLLHLFRLHAFKAIKANKPIRSNIPASQFIEDEVAPAGWVVEVTQPATEGPRKLYYEAQSDAHKLGRYLNTIRDILPNLEERRFERFTTKSPRMFYEHYFKHDREGVSQLSSDIEEMMSITPEELKNLMLDEIARSMLMDAAPMKLKNFFYRVNQLLRAPYADKFAPFGKDTIEGTKYLFKTDVPDQVIKEAIAQYLMAKNKVRNFLKENYGEVIDAYVNRFNADREKILNELMEKNTPVDIDAEKMRKLADLIEEGKSFRPKILYELLYSLLNAPKEEAERSTLSFAGRTLHQRIPDSPQLYTLPSEVEKSMENYLREKALADLGSYLTKKRNTMNIVPTDEPGLYDVVNSTSGNVLFKKIPLEEIRARANKRGWLWQSGKTPEKPHIGPAMDELLRILKQLNIPYSDDGLTLEVSGKEALEALNKLLERPRIQRFDTIYQVKPGKPIK